jgi:hypothetical protein
MNFEDTEAAFEKAKARMDRFVVKRARELYEGYDRYPEDDEYDAWGNGGDVMTKKECRKDALKSLQEGKTAEEIKAQWEADRQVLRTVYLTPAVDEKLRVRAFREKRQKNDLMVEAIAIYLQALEEAND